MSFQHSADETFKGACVDSEAQQSAIGSIQARTCCLRMSSPVQEPTHRKAFHFGDGIFQRTGFQNVRIPTPQNTFLQFKIDVVKGKYVPLFLDLDSLDNFYLDPDTFDNLLVIKRKNWTMQSRENIVTNILDGRRVKYCIRQESCENEFTLISP